RPRSGRLAASPDLRGWTGDGRLGAPRADRRLRPDVHRRARNRHRAHAQGERRRVPGRARRGHRAVRPGNGDGALVRAFFFTAAYLAAKRWLDRLLHHMLKLTANEAVPGCVFALVLVYAISADMAGER